MQYSSSANKQGINPATALLNDKTRGRIPYYYMENSKKPCTKYWNKPNNSKRKTLRTHRKGYKYGF